MKSSNDKNGKNGAHAPEMSGDGSDPTRAPLVNAFEGAACLRTLIGFAKSGGPLTAAELAVLEEAWDKLELPATITFQSLMAEQIDLNKQLALIVSEEGRERTYTATFLFTHSGGPCSVQQQKYLNTIRAALQISATMETPLSRIYAQVRERVFPALSRFIEDPLERAKKIDEEILKFAMSNAVTGAFPIRARVVATGVIIVSTQAVMVCDIGKYWGYTLDQQGAQKFMVNINGDLSMRIAIQSLLRDGAILENSHACNPAFFATWALGYAANEYFQSGCKLEKPALHEFYAVALKDAEAACEKCHVEIAAAILSRSITLDLLHEEFTAGKLNTEEYDRKIMGLP